MTAPAVSLEPKLEVELQRLLLLLRQTTGAVVTFAVYRDVLSREAVVRRLRQFLPVREFVLSSKQPDPVALALSGEGEAPLEKRAILCFYDLEEALPRVLGHLELRREAFAAHPHAALFWVRYHGLQEVARRAPNFWAWRSEVFDFRPARETDYLALAPALALESLYYADRGDLERRLSLYASLLEEYARDHPQRKEVLAELERKLGLGRYHLGEWGQARGHWERALALSREGDHEEGIAISLHNLGILAQDQGDYAQARRLYQESLALKEELGDKRGIAITVHQLGILAELQGDYPQAQRLYQESLALKEELGDKAGIARTKHQLGMLAQLQGDYPQAQRLYQESLAIEEELGNKLGIAQTKGQLANLALGQGKYGEAMQLYQEITAIFKELGDKRGIARTKHQLGNLAQRQGDYPQAQRLYQESLALKEELGDKRGIAITVHQLGMLAEEQGQKGDAARLYAEALAIFEALGAPEREIARRSLERVSRGRKRKEQPKDARAQPE